MPWQEQSIMTQRREFVTLARTGTVSVPELCRRFGISRSSGYALLARYAELGEAGLVDQSRRPRTSPHRTPEELEAAVLAVRDAHPAWGGRKIHHVLRSQGDDPVPAPSTITDILRRHQRLTPATPPPTVVQQFEYATPNALWQMDFMGPRPLAQGAVHPLSVIDDHSRYGLALVGCADQREATVKAVLTDCFRRYGLPERILTDNGPPWGPAHGGMTALEAWFTRLGVAVLHGRAYHPQTQGKVERWHRTIAVEVFPATRVPYRDLEGVQHALDRFREHDNQQRPHHALAYAVPASRYTPSARPFPPELPAVAYSPDDVVLKVRSQGAVVYAGKSRFVSTGLIGEYVGIRPTDIDGVVQVIYAHLPIITFDLRCPSDD
jgi:transposase InsO family protein